jgi:hypothetical protein
MTPAEREAKYRQVDVVLLYLEDARAVAARAADELRATGAEDFLYEAIEQVQEDISAASRRLIQGTFFTAPTAQLSAL